MPSMHHRQSDTHLPTSCTQGTVILEHGEIPPPAYRTIRVTNEIFIALHVTNLKIQNNTETYI